MSGVIVFTECTCRLRKKMAVEGFCYCLIIVCFGISSRRLREMSEGLPRPSRSRPEAALTQTIVKHE